MFPRLKHGFVIFGRSKDIWMRCLALKMSIKRAYMHLKALLGSAQHVLVETRRSFSCQSRFLNFSAGGSRVVSAADAAQPVPGVSNELHLINRAHEPSVDTKPCRGHGQAGSPGGDTARAHFQLVSGGNQLQSCTTPRLRRWRRTCGYVWKESTRQSSPARGF